MNDDIPTPRDRPESPAIRAARADDVDVVYRLIGDLEQTAFPFAAFRELFVANLAAERIGYFVAERQDRVVGFGSVHLSCLLHHCGTVAEIQELVVDPGYRGSGIGRSLLERLDAWARDAGAGQLEVASNRRRTDSHRFYQSLGFEHTHKKFVRPLD